MGTTSVMNASYRGNTIASTRRKIVGGNVGHSRTMKDSELGDILEELSAREPIFHRREFGTSRQDLDRMMDANFWEIGASGKVYQRNVVIETLLERYRSGPEPHDWPCRNFTLTVLAEALYLLSYILDEPGRVTRRSTIWRWSHTGWKIVFHQGTMAN
jgi:hypothetical protein